jgi:hypothetical protein
MINIVLLITIIIILFSLIYLVNNQCSNSCNSCNVERFATSCPNCKMVLTSKDMKKKKVIITYSCYNPPVCLVESIQSVYNLQITNEYYYKIICIDNGSNILTSYDIIKKKFPYVEIIYANNKNYEWGAYKYTLNNFPNYDIYFCLQDTIIIKKQIDLTLIKNNCTYTHFHLSGFHSHLSIKKNNNYNRLMKNINLNVDDIIDSYFNLARNNIYIITKSDLHDLFETFTNPPIEKIDTNIYERLIGMYFIKKKIKTIDMDNNIIKISRYKRHYDISSISF